MTTNSEPLLANNYFTAEEMIDMERSNGARFKRDAVGKMATIKGIVKGIQPQYFTISADNSISGWDVFIKDTDLLSNLNKGDAIEFTCIIVDRFLVGGASDCNDPNSIIKTSKRTLEYIESTIATPPEEEVIDNTNNEVNEDFEPFKSVVVNTPGDGFLALRSDPSSKKGYRVSKIPHGTKINLLDCVKSYTTDHSWCKTTYNGESGWVSSKFTITIR